MQLCCTYRYICEYISACVLDSYTKYADYDASMCSRIYCVMCLCVCVCFTCVKRLLLTRYVCICTHNLSMGLLKYCKYNKYYIYITQ